MQQPQILEKPELTVVGRRGAFIHALSPDANNLQVIGQLWNEFLDARDSISHRVGDTMYGVIYSEPQEQRSHRHELQYIACVPVSSTDDVPEGLIAYTIPASMFAVFTHRGPMGNIGQTVEDAYRNWLPASRYDPTEVADVEQYDHRFCPDEDGVESVMEYWIAVTPKNAGD